MHIFNYNLGKKITTMRKKTRKNIIFYTLILVIYNTDDHKQLFLTYFDHNFRKNSESAIQEPFFVATCV